MEIYTTLELLDVLEEGMLAFDLEGKYCVFVNESGVFQQGNPVGISYPLEINKEMINKDSSPWRIVYYQMP